MHPRPSARRRDARKRRLKQNSRRKETRQWRTILISWAASRKLMDGQTLRVLQSFVKGPEGNCADLGQGMTLRTVGVRWAEGYPSKIRAGAPKPALRLGFHH